MTIDLPKIGQTNWGVPLNVALAQINGKLDGVEEMPERVAEATAAASAAEAAAVRAEAAEGTFTAPANDVVATMVAADGPTKAALSATIAEAVASQPRGFAGAVPDGLGWPAAYPVTPTVEVGWDGTAVGSIGVTAEEFFDQHSTARATPTVTIYVNVGGATSIDGVAWGAGGTGNSGLSPDTPCKTISQGIAAANTAAPTGGARVLVAAGEYDVDNGWATTSTNSPAGDIALVAVGGLVRVGPWHQVGTPAKDATHTNCYVVPSVSTSTSATRIIDRANPDRDGVFPDLVRAASVADCNATPNTWFQDGTNVYIHRADGRPVTLATTWLLRRKHSFLFQVGVSAYIGGNGIGGCGFEIIGGRDGGNIRLEPTAIPDSAKVVVVADTTLAYAGGVGNSSDTDANSLTVGDNFFGLVACFRVRCVAAFKDGFNLHKASAVGHQALLTVNCEAVDMGRGNTLGLYSSCNAWTLHNAAVGIDVAGDYWRTRGGAVHDVNTSKAYLLGTRSAHDAGDIEGGNNIPPTQYKTNDTAQMWLEACAAIGGAQTLAYAATASSAIRLRNSPGTRLSSLGNVTSY